MNDQTALIKPVYTPPERRPPLYRVAQLWRNFIGCWPLVGIMFIGMLISAVAVPLSPEGWGMRTAYGLYRIWARWVLRGFGVRVWVKGMEHLDRAWPGVIVSNHRSHLDLVALGAVISRPSVAVHKRSLEYIPVLGQVILLSGSVGVDRKDAPGSRRRMQIVMRRLNNGRSVLIFPEGKRSRGAQLESFKKGAAVVALEQGCNLIPLTIHGTDVLYPPGSIMIHRGDVLVEVHPPIPTAGRSLEERDGVTAEIRSAISGPFLPGPVQPSQLKGAVRLV